MIINEDFFDNTELDTDVVKSEEDASFGTKFMIVVKSGYITTDTENIKKRLSYVLKNNTQIEQFLITDTVEKPGGKKAKDEVDIIFYASCEFKIVKHIYDFLLRLFSCVYPNTDIIRSDDYFALGYAEHGEKISGYVYDITYKEVEELQKNGEENHNVFNQWFVFLSRIKGMNQKGWASMSYSEVEDMKRQFVEMCKFFMGEITDEQYVYIDYYLSLISYSKITICIDAAGELFYSRVMKDHEKVTSVHEDVMGGNVETKVIDVEKLKSKISVINNSKRVEVYFATAPCMKKRSDYVTPQYPRNITIKRLTTVQDIEIIEPFMWVAEKSSFWRGNNEYIRIEDDVKFKHIAMSYVGYCRDKQTKKIMFGIFIINADDIRQFNKLVNTIYKDVR